MQKKFRTLFTAVASAAVIGTGFIAAAAVTGDINSDGALG